MKEMHSAHFHGSTVSALTKAHGRAQPHRAKRTFGRRPTFSLCGGSETRRCSCHLVSVLLWRESEERPACRSEVSCQHYSVFFLTNTNTGQMEIHFSSSQEPGAFPTSLHQRDYKYNCYCSYYSVITGRSVCTELQDCKSLLCRADERTVGTDLRAAH